MKTEESTADEEEIELEMRGESPRSFRQVEG